MARTPKIPLDSVPPDTGHRKCDACGVVSWDAIPEVERQICDDSPKCRGLLRTRDWIGWWNRAHEKEVRSEWMTPPELFAQIDAVAHFNLDVASSSGNCLCTWGFTKRNSALENDWMDRWWLNPPFTRLSPFMEKAIEQADAGRGGWAIVPASTETEWYRASAEVASDIYMLSPRVSFVPPEGIPESGNGSASHLMVFRPELVKAPPRFIPWRWK